MRKLIQDIIPTYCVCCLSITRGLPICQACIHELPWNESACYQCGLPIETRKKPTLCGACITRTPPFNHTLALFAYQAPIIKFITQLKFNRELLYAKLLGNLLASQINTNRRYNSLPECIIPVPLHRKRLRQRGFNQALEIAKPIAKKLLLPIDYKTCLRDKNTQPQSELPAKKRHQNVKNAFTLKKNFSASHVAIVDDVMTTGSTVKALSNTLKTHGVKHIEIWCCARAMLI